MEIENQIRYTALAVGLKPSAIQGKARLRGLWRIIAVLRYVEPLTGFLERSIFASGGLKPYLRSDKPCGLDQPGDPRQREG